MSNILQIFLIRLAEMRFAMLVLVNIKCLQEEAKGKLSINRAMR